jgi:hypothetical protein
MVMHVIRRSRAEGVLGHRKPEYEGVSSYRDYFGQMATARPVAWRGIQRATASS